MLRRVAVRVCFELHVWGTAQVIDDVVGQNTKQVRLLENVEVAHDGYMLQSVTGNLDVRVVALVEPFGELNVKFLQRRNLRLYVHHGLYLLDILWRLDDAHHCVCFL